MKLSTPADHSHISDGDEKAGKAHSFRRSNDNKNGGVQINHRVSYFRAVGDIGRTCKQKKVRGLKILTS